jgi:xanthine dehydrogenase accessory factor
VPIVAQFDGVIRGLVMEGLPVTKGMKVGDVDPRKDPRLCNLVSDKSLAVGGGALEAVLSIPELRRKLC